MNFLVNIRSIDVSLYISTGIGFRNVTLIILLSYNIIQEYIGTSAAKCQEPDTIIFLSRHNTFICELVASKEVIGYSNAIAVIENLDSYRITSSNVILNPKIKPFSNGRSNTEVIGVSIA